MKRLLEFTRDLFGSAEPPAVAPPVPVPVPVGPRRRRLPLRPGPSDSLDFFDPAPAPTEPALPRPGPGTLTPEPLDQVLAPLQFRHPQANREARLHGTWVAYHFKRASRRSIGFVIRPEGLVVSAPRWVPLAQVDAALADKGHWVLRKLAEVRQRQDRQMAARVDWADGARLPYLGEPLQVCLGAGELASGRLERLDDEAAQAAGLRHRLHIGLPPLASPEQIRDAVQAWLMREARALFVQRLDHYAPQLGVQWKKLALSNALTRWGSARVDGAIRLNWRLMHFSLAVIDYVVVHELAHLRVMDHSPRFWGTVATLVPDYAERRDVLKDTAVPRW